MITVLIRFVSLLLLLGMIAPAQAKRVSITAGEISLPAHYLPPVQPQKPAILVMHGCGGLYNRQGEVGSRLARMGSLFQEMGYAVLFLDSFSSRGIRQTCTSRSAARKVTPVMRAGDARTAVRWLRRQRNVDKNRIGVIGWSHGADAILALLGAQNPSIKAAVTYYPACRLLAGRKNYRVSAPTLVLIGENDAWTPGEDCSSLAAESGQDLFHVVTYPGVAHDFDAPVASPQAQGDVPNVARNADMVFSAPSPDAAHDANRRTFKWFARWFDPDRAIKGPPPSKKDRA